MQTQVLQKYGIAIIYLIVCSIIPVDTWFLGSSVLHNVFFVFKWSAFLVLLIFYIKEHLCFKNRVFTTIMLFCITLFISTIINLGSLRKAFSLFYTTFSICSFIIIICRDKRRIKQFVSAISSLYFFISIINFILFIFAPSLFSDREYYGVYFLGGENHLVYPLMIGLFYNIVALRLELISKRRLYAYIILFWITILSIWSGMSLLGSVILFLLLCFKPISAIVKRTSLIYLYLMILGVVFLIVFLSVGGNNESAFSKYIVETIIGKDMTFSGRVYVWDEVISKISMRPLLGHGLSDSRNLFSYFNSLGQTWSPNLSSHNEYLAILYEGGILALGLVILHIKKLSRTMSNSSKFDVVSKSFVIAISFLYLAEAPSMSALFELTTFCALYNKIYSVT